VWSAEAADCKGKGKGKSVPLQLPVPRGFQEVKVPRLRDNGPDGGKVVSLTHRPLLPPRKTPGTHFRWRLSRPDFTSMKNPLTPAGFEPATFRFVAQHLIHCATAVPPEAAAVPNHSSSRYCRNPFPTVLAPIYLYSFIDLLHDLTGTDLTTLASFRLHVAPAYSSNKF